MPAAGAPGPRAGGSTACCCSTSPRACRRTRRCSARSALYAAEKAGHTGTLDPLATGLLPLCFGDATKFAQALLDAPQGIRRDGALRRGDDHRRRRGRDGAHLRRGVLARRARVGAAAFRRPDRADAAARSRRSSSRAATTTNTRAPASTFPASPRAIEIGAIELVDWSPPLAVLRVACSKGTYIRVLAEDIAGALGCCAHLAALRRTVAGPFALGRRGDAGGARGDGRRGARRAAAAGRRAACRARAARRGRVDRAGPRGRARRARAAGSVRTMPLLRPAGAVSRAGRSDRRASCARCASRARTRPADPRRGARRRRFGRAGLALES